MSLGAVPSDIESRVDVHRPRFRRATGDIADLQVFTTILEATGNTLVIQNINIVNHDSNTQTIVGRYTDPSGGTSEFGKLDLLQGFAGQYPANLQIAAIQIQGMWIMPPGSKWEIRNGANYSTDPVQFRVDYHEYFGSPR